MLLCHHIDYFEIKIYGGLKFRDSEVVVLKSIKLCEKNNQVTQATK
jgi:hypothetical protein